MSFPRASTKLRHKRDKMRHKAKIFLITISILVPLVSCSLFEKKEALSSKELLPQLEVTPQEWSWQAPFPHSTSNPKRRPSAIPADQDSMVLLGYYHFNRSLTDSKTTTPELFQQQISYLKQHSFQFVGLPQMQSDSKKSSVLNPKVALLLRAGPNHSPKSGLISKRKIFPCLFSSTAQK